MKHMIEVGAPDECIAEMRSYLHLEGWLELENLCLEREVVEHEDLLPKGWLLRIDENSCEGAVEKPDFDVGKLPNGWYTKNKPGDKGFRIYSPSGSIYLPIKSFKSNF